MLHGMNENDELRQEIARLRRRVDELEASAPRRLDHPGSGPHVDSARSALRLEALLAALPDMVFRIARDGTFLDFLAPKDSTILPADRIIGSTLSDLPLLPQALEQALQTIERTLETGEMQYFNYTLPDRQGKRHFEARFAAGGRDEVVAIVRDMTDSCRAQQELTRHLRREQMIARISQGFNQCNPEQPDGEIQRALTELGRFAEADRSYLLLLDDSATTFTNSHEWCRRGVSPQRALLQNLAVEEFDWAWRPLLRGEVLEIASVADLPGEAQAVRAFLEQQQIASLVIVPLSVGGMIGGGIGFDNVLGARRWAAEDIGLLHTAADIIAAALQRQHIAAALRNSQQKFANAFEASPDAITLTALADGRLVEANAAFERMLMWSRDEAIGQTIRELGLWAESADRERLLHHVETQSIVGNFETRLRTRPGRTINVLISSRLMEINGQPHLLSVARDVTERKRRELELRELNAELERRVAQRTAALESFSHSIAHDLRTPLRGINGFSHLLLEEYGDHLDDSGREYLDRVLTGTRHMGEIIDDLHTLSQITCVDMRTRPVDLSAMAGEIVRELRQMEPARQVDVITAANVSATGDAQLLRLALENLLGNAWKFTSHRDGARIEFGVDNSASTPIFVVRDNGAGFDTAYARKLFEPFERLHGVHEFPGTGIGLAIVRRVIERHGGRVWAEAAPDVGATLRFTLG